MGNLLLKKVFNVCSFQIQTTMAFAMICTSEISLNITIYNIVFRGIPLSLSFNIRILKVNSYQILFGMISMPYRE